MANGLFGLGGIGGIGGAQPPAGLLGPYFNPADMRKQQLKQGLLAAGIGLLTGGKGSTGEVLGQGLAAGLQGANNAGINYKQDAMGYQQLDMQMQEQRAKEEEKKRLMDWVSKQPPEMQNFLAVNPEAGAKLWQEQKIKGMFPAGEGGVKRGLVPQYGVDAQGNPVLLQLGDDATAAQTKMPEGVTLSKAPIKLDAGTHYVLLDPITRQPVGTIPKELAEAERQKVIGKGEGEAASLNASLSSKLPGLQKVVGDLEVLADKATYTKVGQARDFAMKEMGMEPTDSAIARAEYIAMVDNQVLPMLRDTFGAQFTVVEGETLRKTLGDPNKQPAEKKAVLRAFIAQKLRDVEAAGVHGGVAPAPTQNQTPRLRFNPQTGDFE